MKPQIPANHPALFKGEKPMVATLENGEQVTVIHREGTTLYRTPGYPGNFGGVASEPLPLLNHFWIPLKGGCSVSLFVNVETGLVVVDIANRAGNGGREVIRKTISI